MIQVASHRSLIAEKPLQLEAEEMDQLEVRGSARREA